MDPDDSQNQYPPRPPPSSSGGYPKGIPTPPPPPNTTSFPGSPSFPLPLSVESPFPEPPPFSPFLSFDSFETQFESKPTFGNEPASTAAGGESLSAAPQPLEALYETPVPPFLSKTFDLVDDHSLDPIISWGVKGDSFVVWDPVEFARMILPRNFKHNNFSSFVRQLNTYGFRKIDTDKWEFANEGFIRGQRHLLKNIQRRKSAHSQQIGNSSGSSDEAGKAALEGEVEQLRKERSLLMREVVELQHQQHGTVQRMGIVNEKLEKAEKRQKQMVSFLGKIFQKPDFLAHLRETREQKRITSPRTTRRFVKHVAHEPDTSGSSPKGQIVKYQHDQSSHTTPSGALDPEPATVEFPGYPLQEFLDVPEQAEAVNPTLGATDPLLKGKGVAGLEHQSTPEYFVSFPEELAKEKSAASQFSISAVSGSMEMEEGIWNTGLGGMSSSTLELWSNDSNYDVAEFGGISDVWDIGSLQPGGSLGIGKWPDEDAPFDKPESQEGRPRDDSSK